MIQLLNKLNECHMRNVSYGKENLKLPPGLVFESPEKFCPMPKLKNVYVCIRIFISKLYTRNHRKTMCNRIPQI